MATNRSAGLGGCIPEAGLTINPTLRQAKFTAIESVQPLPPRRHGPFPDADLRRFAGEPHAVLLSCAGKGVTAERGTDDEVHRDLMADGVSS